VLLLTYVVESGHTVADGRIAPEAAFTSIPEMKAAIDNGTSVSVQQWVAFETSYRDLVLWTYPVTADTLKNTDPGKNGAQSAARKFSALLWKWTIFFAVFVVFGDFGFKRFGVPYDGWGDPWNTIMQAVTVLVPYAYGALGACVYLLRSAHEYLLKRTFDVRAQPEYLNRILLGGVAGGAIILFMDQLTTGQNTGIQLGTAALGFLAGYNADFLFKTIERVVAAIFPKEVQGVTPAPTPTPTPTPVSTVTTTGTATTDTTTPASSEDEKEK
jgi:hypothetical protein